MSKRDSNRIVLIVEDDRRLAEALAETLDLGGLQTTITSDGNQALALARLLQPDLILLDMMIPGISGIQVCENLKSQPLTADIPVIFVTARTQQGDVASGIAAGASAYLAKPFNPTELIELVENILSGQSVKRLRRLPDLSAEPVDQLVVYARELKRLYEREKVEREALERAHKRLEDLNRLKAEFLGVVTHELLTPFAKIGLPLQVLQRENDTLPPVKLEALEGLATEIAHLHRLINGVVKFAELVNKRREPQPGYISLGQVIPAALQPMAVLAQARDVDFRVFVPADLPRVHADPELLSEAVFQMSHNAIKFTQPGGRVQVRVLGSSGWLVISVRDTGIGLTPEQLSVLGRPFEQSADAVRRGQEGLGIGWAFVCYVAQAHGGRTHAESSGPGQGSTFSLGLPVTVPEQAADAGRGPDTESERATAKPVP